AGPGAGQPRRRPLRADGVGGGDPARSGVGAAPVHVDGRGLQHGGRGRRPEASPRPVARGRGDPRRLGAHRPGVRAAGRGAAGRMEGGGGMSATPDTSRRKRPARWWQRLILASAPDVLGLLVEQGRVSLEAVSAFERWSRGGDGELIQRIRDLEHEADEVRRALTGALREALATPIDQEDLYVLSERCDRVVNAVKHLVRQAEVLEW